MQLDSRIQQQLDSRIQLQLTPGSSCSDPSSRAAVKRNCPQRRELATANSTSGYRTAVTCTSTLVSSSSPSSSITRLKCCPKLQSHPQVQLMRQCDALYIVEEQLFPREEGREGRESIASFAETSPHTKPLRTAQPPMSVRELDASGTTRERKKASRAITLGARLRAGIGDVSSAGKASNEGLIGARGGVRWSRRFSLV